MPKKLKVNYAKLIKAVESGKPVKKVMAQFGINTSAQLRITYLDALISKGKVPELKSSRGRKAKEDKEVSVNIRGSLIIPREMIEAFGFSEGDVFTVRKTKSGLSFKKF